MDEPTYIIERDDVGNEIRAVFGSGPGDNDEHRYAIDALSDFDEDIIDDLFSFFNEKKLTVGMLIKIHVEEAQRGNGHGRQLMGVFMDKVVPNTDIDFLLARVKNQQAKGFNLIRFYESYGFEFVHLSDGDALMVNKGLAGEVRAALSINHQLTNINKNDDAGNEPAF